MALRRACGVFSRLSSSSLETQGGLRSTISALRGHLGALGLWACVCLAVAWPAPARAQFTVGVKLDYAAGNNPYSCELGDLNADGIPDLVVSNQTANTVSVLLGSGGGGFGAKTTFATGNAPYGVAIGDLNADAKPDLVVVNANDFTVSVLLGNGAGGFGAKTDFATGAGPNTVSIGDVSGDGKPDLVVSCYSSSSVSVLLGNGSGGFAPRTDFATGTNCVSVAIGYFNGDGKPDLVAANFNASSVSVLMGDGAGGFGTKTDYAVGTNPRWVSAGDVNSDGVPDLAVANQGSATVSVLLNNGGGGFGAKTDFATGNDPRWNGIGDMDGDGRPDLVVANFLSHNVSVLQGNGAGEFAAKLDFASGNNPEWGAIGDVNGDGKLDVVTANYGSNTASVLLAAPMVGQRINLPVASAGGIAMADLNGDGLADIGATNNATNTVSVCLTTATGFGAWTGYSTGNGPNAVAFGDANGDANLDMVVTNGSDATMSSYVNQGDGTFGPRSDAGTPTTPLNMVFGTFVEGGSAPLVMSPSRVTLMMSNGDGTYQSDGGAGAFNYLTGSMPRTIAVGDVTGDGHTDFVTGNATNVSVLPYVLLIPHPARTDFTPPGTGPYGVALGDLNGDGKPDLAVTTHSRTVLVYLNTGTGFGTTPTTYALPANTQVGTAIPLPIRMRDLTGDGRLDLAVASRADSSGFSVGQLSEFLGDGVGGFGPRIDRHGSLFGMGDVALGDVNGDGRPDLAFPGVSILLTPSPTRTVLAAAPNPVTQGSSITLTATVQPTRIVPTAPSVGTVSFFDGTTLLGSAPVSWSASGSSPTLYTGTATLARAMNRPGVRSLSAIYSGDGRRAGSIAPLVAEVVQPLPVSVPGGSPVAFGLAQLPNPARGGRVSVRFTLSSGTPAVLGLFDLNGRRLAAHDVGKLGAGAHTLELSERPITPGIYFVCLKQGPNVSTARVAVLN